MGNPMALVIFRQRKGDSKLTLKDLDLAEPAEQLICRLQAAISSLNQSLSTWQKEVFPVLDKGEGDSLPRRELAPNSEVTAAKLLIELVELNASATQESEITLQHSHVKELADLLLGVDAIELKYFETLDLLRENTSAALEKLKQIESKGRSRQKAARPKHKLVLGAGKAKTLSGSEKKVVSVVRGILEAAALEYATGENNLNVAFDKMKADLKMATSKMKAESPEEQDSLNTQRELLEKLVQVIDRQNAEFQGDPDLREDFDEDLLQRIGVVGVEVLNIVEGYINPAPAFLETKEYATQKTEARLRRRNKKVEAIKVQQSKNAEKEAKAKEKEAKMAENQKLKAKARDEAKVAKESQKGMAVRNVDEAILTNPTTLGHVSYSKVPFDSLETYERALHIWTTLVSLPKTFKLSTFSFPQFVTMLEDEKQEFSMPQDICKGLAEVNPEGEKMFKTRGRNWFLILMDFVQTVLGTKKKKFKKIETSSEEDSDDETSTDDSTSDEDESSEESASSSSSSSSSDGESELDETPEKDHVEPEPEVQLSGIAAQIRDVVDEFKTYGGMASWLNAELDQRLLILEFLVLRALEEEETIESATALGGESDVIIHEKHIKDIKDDAEKEIRKLKTTTADENERNQKKEAIRKKAEKEIQKLEKNFRSTFDDANAEKRIRPVGLDRYNRIYWRFPKEQVIHVQSVNGFTKPFPLIEPPKSIVDYDEEEDDQSSVGAKRSHQKSDADEELSSRKRRGDDGETIDTTKNTKECQMVWGTISLLSLPDFVTTLDVRGRREGPLRATLEGWLPYLQSIPPPEDGKPQEGRMLSRSKRQNYGYQNTERMTMLTY